MDELYSSFEVSSSTRYGGQPYYRLTYHGTNMKYFPLISRRNISAKHFFSLHRFCPVFNAMFPLHGNLVLRIPNHALYQLSYTWILLRGKMSPILYAFMYKCFYVLVIHIFATICELRCRLRCNIFQLHKNFLLSHA